MIYADTNICLRFILNDNKEMADFANNLLRSGDVYILHEVICEIVYVLNSIYKIDRTEICEAILPLLDHVYVADKEVAVKALHNYEETKLDFVDCMLLAYNQIENIQIATFDKKLKSKLT